MTAEFMLVPETVTCIALATKTVQVTFLKKSFRYFEIVRFSELLFSLLANSFSFRSNSFSLSSSSFSLISLLLLSYTFDFFNSLQVIKNAIRRRITNLKFIILIT